MFNFILVVNLDFWMTVFNKFARSFKSHWLLYLCVIVFGITNLVASSGAHMVQRLLFFVLTILVVKRISSLPLRLLVAAPFVLLTAADMSISLYSWCTFGTTFNDGFAISVLQSDPDEVVKMLGMYIWTERFFIFCIFISKLTSGK